MSQRITCTCASCCCGLIPVGPDHLPLWTRDPPLQTDIYVNHYGNDQPFTEVYNSLMQLLFDRNIPVLWERMSCPDSAFRDINLLPYGRFLCLVHNVLTENLYTTVKVKWWNKHLYEDDLVISPEEASFLETVIQNNRETQEYLQSAETHCSREQYDAVLNRIYVDVGYWSRQSAYAFIENPDLENPPLQWHPEDYNTESDTDETAIEPMMRLNSSSMVHTTSIVSSRRTILLEKRELILKSVNVETS